MDYGTTKIVIGANYGDEGKGILTDHLTYEMQKLAGSDTKVSNSRVKVVRFNGGAQAGHTVVTPGGTRHVFGHFGSGALAGARTHLSQHFISNPLTFVREQDALKQKVEAQGGTWRWVYADPRGLVTIPSDMIVNQLLERSRGVRRHGSCGMGINETVTRSLAAPQFDIRLKDVFNSDPLELINMMKTAEKEYLPMRLSVMDLDPSLVNLNAQAEINRQFLAACREFRSSVGARPDFELEHQKYLIFEGAQGLALDQNNTGDHPFLTRSNTGLRNVEDIFAEWKKPPEKLDVIFCTRTYLTRHGRGPLPHEDEDAMVKVVDETNAPNEWQESLRVAPLDLGALDKRIWAEMNLIDEVPLKTLANVDDLDVYGFISHCDVESTDPSGEIAYQDMYGDEFSTCKPLELAERIADEVMGDPRCFFSVGPTRDDVTFRNVDIPGAIAAELVTMDIESGPLGSRTIMWSSQWASGPGVIFADVPDPAQDDLKSGADDVSDADLKAEA